MKIKTSITLDNNILTAMEKYLNNYKSRSQFIEVASRFYIAHLERLQNEQRDLQIINKRAEALNKEAEDVLAWQVRI